MADLREGLGRFAPASTETPVPAWPADMDPLAVPAPPPAPPTSELDPIAEELTDVIPPVEPSPSGWYRVLSPVETFNGPRLGKTFVDGEVVVHDSERFRPIMPGGRAPSTRLVDLYVRDLHYNVEPIPVGVPPVPRSTLRNAGISAAVANS